jgi:L-2,4-diaminobutyrate decarboxylase
MRGANGFVNLGEIGVQGTRHADALKLWLSLRHLGRNGYAELIDGGYRRIALLLERIRKQAYLKLAGEPDTNILCFRGEPTELSPDRWDTWNEGLQAALLRDQHIFVSLPLYRGQRWLRVVLLNPFTDEGTIQRLSEGIDTYAKATLAGVDTSPGPDFLTTRQHRSCSP